jgi:hypothetical protein
MLCSPVKGHQYLRGLYAFIVAVEEQTKRTTSKKHIFFNLKFRIASLQRYSVEGSTGCLLGLLFDPEYRRGTFLQNIHHASQLCSNSFELTSGNIRDFYLWGD